MSDQPTPLVDAVVFIQPDLNLQVVDADFARRLERVVRMLDDALEELETAGVSFSDPRLRYMEVQVSPDAIKKAEKARAAWRELMK